MDLTTKNRSHYPSHSAQRCSSLSLLWCSGVTDDTPCHARHVGTNWAFFSHQLIAIEQEKKVNTFTRSSTSISAFINAAAKPTVPRRADSRMTLKLFSLSCAWGTLIGRIPQIDGFARRQNNFQTTVFNSANGSLSDPATRLDDNFDHTEFDVFARFSAKSLIPLSGVIYAG